MPPPTMNPAQMYEEREAKSKLDRRLGATVIIDQMRERERERVRQLELQDQERDAMLAQVDVMKQQEIEALHQKKVAGQKLLDEEVGIDSASHVLPAW